MGSVLAFRGEFSDDTNRYETVFVFLPLSNIQPSAIEGALKACVEDGRISPDLVVFIASEINHIDFRRILSDNSLVEWYGRLKRCRGVALCSYRADGALNTLTWIVNQGAPSTAIGDMLIGSARTIGLAHLSGQEGVVVKAPPGAYFRNPSGGRRSYFIRAGLMCRTSIEASFVAFSALPLLARATAFYRSAPTVIWVDTMSIAYLAYAVLDVALQTGALNHRLEIRSFSSYAGFRRTNPAPGEYPIYLISASTSGGLARDLVSEGNGTIDSRTIGTLIGAYDADYPDVLCTLPVERRGPQLASVDTLREIRISGEDFAFSPGEPDVVVLKGWPKTDKFPAIFSHIQGKGLIHYFKRITADRNPKPLLIDDNALIASANFQTWVQEKARGTLPVAVRHIVHQNDKSSKSMADLVFAAISPFCGDSQPRILSIAELDSLQPQRTASVAIVAAVAGSGMELMRVTKALRRFQPEGSRYFLVGIITARSYQQLSQLRSNLTISDESTTYRLECWGEFAPASAAIHHFRQRELNWLRQSLKDAEQQSNEALGSFAKERLRLLEKDGIVHSEGTNIIPFLGLTSSESAFDVGKGFALWSPKFQNIRCPIDVLFSVACWLQNARESTVIPVHDRLDDGGFQQAVIGPDSFLRFTDPVIQASILRAARDSELDYRAAPDVSARAREIIAKFIRLKEESSLEFLMALAFGRMRLCTDDTTEVVEAARHELSDDERVASLLKCIELVAK